MGSVLTVGVIGRGTRNISEISRKVDVSALEDSSNGCFEWMVTLSLAASVVIADAKSPIAAFKISIGLEPGNLYGSGNHASVSEMRMARD